MIVLNYDINDLYTYVKIWWQIKKLVTCIHSTYIMERKWGSWPGWLTTELKQDILDE